MFSFKQSRLFNKLVKDQRVGLKYAIYLTDKLSAVYDAAQYVLRNPTDHVRFEEVRYILESYEDILFGINGLVPSNLKPEWKLYTEQLGDLVQIALISNRQWKNIQVDLDIRLLYGLLLGKRTQRLFIMTSITFLQYMDIRFSCIEGHPVTGTRVHEKCRTLMSSIGSAPIQKYGEMFENYFYHDHLVTNARLSDYLPYA